MEAVYRDLIDTHVHLDEMPGLESAVRRAIVAGVGHMVAVGMDLASNRRTLELARQFPGVVLPAVGYHPWKISEKEIDETLAFVTEHLAECAALGEVGLDYKVKVKKTLQQTVFSRLLRSAKETGKPVNVHSRFSYERTHKMVAAAGIERAVFHWYSGPPEILERLLSDGYFISATPALSYSKFHQAAVRLAPIEKILIETDAPQAYQGVPSEPAHLLNTVVLLSRIKKLPVSETVRITTENAHRFYPMLESDERKP